ncbi:MAG: beta-ketoacyl synthase N-terminal-like domain-containing protein, partial [Candidatus Omnitrophica bacterium]|nr:beta-ketoacyl synthase N-terminal-like domain-containing protein [Candidatus Omnitrophota bacterium]
MEKRRVVITGMGVLSPVGSGVEKFWSALLAGKSGIHRIDRFDPTDFPCQICGDVRDYNPADHFDVKEARHLSRFIQLAVVAAREARQQANLDIDRMDQHRCGIVVGSGVGALETLETNFTAFLNRGPKKISPFFIPQFIVNEAAGQIAIEMKAKGLAT